MQDSTAYCLTRPSAPRLRPVTRKAMALILVAITSILFVVGLSGTTAHRSQAATPLLVREGVPTLDHPAAFTSMLENVMLADARLGQASFYAKQYPHAPVWHINYKVMVNSCLRAVAKYDAAASKYTMGAFINQGLPKQIDNTAAPTDCREPAP